MPSLLLLERCRFTHRPESLMSEGFEGSNFNGNDHAAFLQSKTNSIHCAYEQWAYALYRHICHWTTDNGRRI